MDQILKINMYICDDELNFSNAFSLSTHHSIRVTTYCCITAAPPLHHSNNYSQVHHCYTTAVPLLHPSSVSGDFTCTERKYTTQVHQRGNATI